MLAEHEHVRARRLDLLQTPVERVYPVADPEVAARLGLAALAEAASPGPAA